jgi:hypothetical protein
MFATFLVLFLIGTLGFMSLSRLKRIAGEIAHNTLPGVSLAGRANAYLADANRVMLYILTDEPAQRAEIRQEIDGLSTRTTGYLNEYRMGIHSPEQQQLFDTLVTERNNYIVTRNRILEIAATGNEAEAITQVKAVLLPAHKRIKNAGDDLISYDIREGETRSKEIMATCTLTQITVAAMGVLVFIVGFIIGLFR